jgi:hypothetical protein
MAKQDLLDQTADALYRELELKGGDPLKLPPVQQPVAILYTIQAIVDNGGFRYLFENQYDAPYAVFVAAYSQIGAEDAAVCLEKAVARFPFENPHLDREARLEFMDSLNESDELFELDDKVCGDESVWQLMEEYVTKNLDVFPK